MSQAYLQLLAEHGLLRDDLSADEVAYAFLATLEGFIQAERAIASRVVELFAGLGEADRGDLGIGEG